MAGARQHKYLGPLMFVAAALVVPTVADAGGPIVSSTSAERDVSDTIAIVKDDERVSNADIASRLLDATAPEAVERVLISRDDEFADALASGVLQAEAPLLLVPSDGPIPTEVARQIQEYGASEAVVLGGELAVSEGVMDELVDLGLTVSRRMGSSRFETAIDIASSDAAAADTVLLARAFPAADSQDPTQAFADALAAGGLAAREGWPIVLTQTEELSAPTREFLASTTADRVLVLGGTAAISDGVFQEAVALVGSGERIAGLTRGETAVEVAKVAGGESAADVAQVILVEGGATDPAEGLPDPWAAGFASAFRAARTDAPILLTLGGTLPPATAEYLSEGIAVEQGQPAITCTTPGPACEQARSAAGLPPLLDIRFNPPAQLTSGQQLLVDLDGYTGEYTISGTCLSQNVSGTADGVILLQAGTDLPESVCTVVVDGLQLGLDSVQTERQVFSTANIQIQVQRTFDTPGNEACGIAVDGPSRHLFVTRCDGETIFRYGTDGAALDPGLLTVPFGAFFNGIDIVAEDTTILGQDIAEGSLLIGAARAVTVIDSDDGGLLAGPQDLSVPSAIAGVAWHGGDAQIVVLPRGADDISRHARSDLRLLSTTTIEPDGAPDFLNGNFAGLEVGCDASVFLVSNESGDVIRHISATGVHLGDLPVPGLSQTSSDIAIDHLTGETFIVSTRGLVTALSGVPHGCTPSDVAPSLAPPPEPPQTDPLTVVDHLSVLPGSQTCGLALDGAEAIMYVTTCQDQTVWRFDTDGTALMPETVPSPLAPGMNDLDVIPRNAAVAGTDVPAGSLILGDLFKRLAVIDPSTGAVLLGPLDGPDVQGGQPGVAWDADQLDVLIARRLADVVSRIDGATLTLDDELLIAPPGSPPFTLPNLGDLEHGCNGSIFIVSSDSGSVVRELAPNGAYVTDHPVSEIVQRLTGIGIDEVSGDTYLLGESGAVTVVSDLPHGCG